MPRACQQCAGDCHAKRLHPCVWPGAQRKVCARRSGGSPAMAHSKAKVQAATFWQPGSRHAAPSTSQVSLSRSSAVRLQRSLLFYRDAHLVRSYGPEMLFWITQIELVTAIGNIMEWPDNIS